MSEPLTPRLRRQASLYVLKALPDKERKAFESALGSRPELQAYTEELERTLNLTRVMSTVKPTEAYLEGQRNLLRGRIEYQLTRQRRATAWQSLQAFGASLVNILTGARQPVWAVSLYVVAALLVGRFLLAPAGTPPTAPAGEAQVDLRRLFQQGTLKDAEIKVSEDGEPAINLALYTNQTVNVAGDLENEQVQQLLYYLLLHDENPGTRLKAVRLMEKIDPAEELKLVLIASLLSDPNPGVRLRAVRILLHFDPDDVLLNACQKVLLEDNNEAVRMGALSILAKQPAAAIPTLRIVSLLDENDFIRNQANKILTLNSDQFPEENIEVLP
jgi:hypothetical protein